MITRNLTLTITDKSVSLDKSIILYKYDRGVTFNFKLISADYTFNEAEITKARAIIKRPNKDISVSEIDEILDGVYTFYLDGSYTNDASEVGIYTMQLQLYSNSDECITIAPFTFEIKDLIGVPDDDTAYAGYSTVNHSSAKSSEVLDTGDLANGEYLETVWVDKDIITTGRLNKIETVLDYLVEDAANNEGGSIDGPITDLEAVNSISMGRIGEVGANSVALGTNCQAGDNASAIGYGLIAKAGVMQKGQCVVGKYNEQDTSAYFIIGDGKADTMRSNAFVVTSSEIIANKNIKANRGLEVHDIHPNTISVGGVSSDGSTKQVLITDQGILIKSEVKYDEDGPRLTPEEDYVPTKEYVDNAIAAIEIPEGGNELPIRVIGSDDPDNPYVLTGNEFTDEEYANDWCGSVLIKSNVSINYTGENGFPASRPFDNDLVYMCIWLDGDNKVFDIKDQYGHYDEYTVSPDGVITNTDHDDIVYDYQLEDYATKEELQTALGDIDSILGGI